VSVEPNSIKAFVEVLRMGFSDTSLFEIEAMFGFTLTFTRVLSVLKSGYPAESIGYHFHRELLLFQFSAGASDGFSLD